MLTNFFINEANYKKLSPTGTNPIMYGLAKVHKPLKNWWFHPLDLFCLLYWKLEISFPPLQKGGGVKLCYSLAKFLEIRYCPHLQSVSIILKILSV